MSSHVASDLNDLINSVSCTFDTHKHLLQQAIELPCKRHACLNCIQSKLNYDKQNELRCVYCGSVHLVDEEFLANKRDDQNVDDKISSNIDRIYNYLLNDLELHLLDIKGTRKST